ncbi:MAG: protein-disulfide reductase DsbD [Chlorobi bacterium]|nr:protein-disulfide reductase DsbD [Chlorobiota bacterium]MCI0715397.1 protein-disulfide reductase DsbD [Chlorobiota bacterium]
MAKILSSVLFILIATLSYCQQYVTVSAASTKKEYFASENIRINVKAEIQSGFHINANKVSDEDLIPTTIDIEGSDFKLGRVSWPAAHKFKFSFSETELDVFEGSINIGLNVKARKDLKPGKYEITGNLHYQACNDRACFAPKDAPFSVNVTIKQDTAKVDTSKSDVIPKDTLKKSDTTGLGEIKDTTRSSGLKENPRDTTKSIISTENKNQIAAYIEENGLLVALLFIFGIGLALNLTPCVYPLIPITISYFGAQVSGSTGKKTAVAVIYVLGMSVTYSVLGLIASLTGGVFGSLLQSPIVIIILVLIFIALALSMFGLYEIRVPQSLANMGAKNRQGFAGTFVMGLTVGFIAAPCIGPLVLSLLVYVGQIGDAFLGFTMFFVLSLGLGFPYIFLAVFSSSITKLPRSGEWMEGVKIIFGLMMLGLALYMAQPLMSAKLYELLFPVFLILAGAYLILVDRKAVNSALFTRIKYFIAIAGIVWGSMNLQFEDEQPFAGKYEWQLLQSQKLIDESIANTNGKPTIIDFYADWCAQCKELDKYTYVDPKIIELSKNFNNIKVDLTKGDKEIESRFKIQGLPVVAFIDKSGKEREDLRVTGFLNPAEFQKVMEKAVSN